MLICSVKDLKEKYTDKLTIKIIVNHKLVELISHKFEGENLLIQYIDNKLTTKTLTPQEFVHIKN